MLKIKTTTLKNKTQPWFIFAHTLDMQMEDPACRVSLYLHSDLGELSLATFLFRTWIALQLRHISGIWHCGLHPCQTTQPRSLLRVFPTINAFKA